ncbi:Abi family protein [Streptomyces sp. NL15-2K]|uniref:Abi family protein n=1 Tax=Streptomyces sp. NL15-2K TaxID=376149 RepID=UPI000F567AA7|nr:MULTISPECIES: Abi family protein [Actinomycetes]WKX11445.1 Abi family protein [Kutzneria buriramensis]GCB47132.1 hypothetical protein SNL152K_4434 [Streptomyces sp. NL15-2K]
MVTDEEAKRIVDSISAERFQPYLDDCGGDPLVALRLYCWDGEASRAFLGALRDFEVAMRNSFHARLSGRYGHADWWDSPRVRLTSKGTQQVDSAKQALRQELGQNFTPGDMVAKLTLGFWVGLTGRGQNYEMQFWNPALRHAFRGYRGRRGALQQELDHIRRFRNRIGHHERICHRHLEKDYETLLRLMKYVSPEKAALHRQFSQIPEVLARRPLVLAGAEPVRL